MARAALLPVLLLAAAGQLPGAAAKGYYDTTYGSTYYHGATEYYYYDEYGNRHYYTTRNWPACSGHCDQTVYIDQASWTVTSRSGAFDDDDSPEQVQEAVALRWPGLDEDLVQVTHRSGSSMDVRVTLPDGTSTQSFQSTIESGCSNMYGGVTGVTVACPTSITLTTVSADVERGGDAAMTVLLLVLAVGGCIFLLFLLNACEVDHCAKDWINRCKRWAKKEGRGQKPQAARKFTLGAIVGETSLDKAMRVGEKVAIEFGKDGPMSWPVTPRFMTHAEWAAFRRVIEDGYPKPSKSKLCTQEECCFVDQNSFFLCIFACSVVAGLVLYVSGEGADLVEGALDGSRTGTETLMLILCWTVFPLTACCCMPCNRDEFKLGYSCTGTKNRALGYHAKKMVKRHNAAMANRGAQLRHAHKTQVETTTANNSTLCEPTTHSRTVVKHWLEIVPLEIAPAAANDMVRNVPTAESRSRSEPEPEPELEPQPEPQRIADMEKERAAVQLQARQAMAQLKSVRSPRSPLPLQTTHPPIGLSATVWTD